MADTSVPNSSNTFTREYSWLRCKAQQTPNVICVIEVGSAARQAFSGSHQRHLGFGPALELISQVWTDSALGYICVPESSVKAFPWASLTLRNRRVRSRFVCPSHSSALILTIK